MIKTITFLVAIVCALTSVAQNFEGKITFTNTYESKMPGVSDELLTKMMGSTQLYFIKDKEYKSETNGSLLMWQLYVGADNKLYNKLSNSDTLMYYDGASNSDEIIKAELKKNAAEILGYMCDELVLTCKSGTQIYYFNSNISIDPTLYENHKFGNWYDIISRTKALPLKAILVNPQFTFTSTAISIQPIQLAKEFFTLPTGAITKKSVQ